MSSPTTLAVDAAPAIRHTAAGRQIRGSSLLLAGRFVARGINFSAQVLTVRYLSQSDFGALAYALSIAILGQDVSRFGMNWAVARFVPIYRERQEYDKVFGTILMAVGTVLAIGLSFALLLLALKGIIGRTVVTDPRRFRC